MEVSGKKARKLCKICEEHNLSKNAGGFCTQCSKHMCIACFDKHKQFKLNRRHRFVSADEAGTSGEQLENYVFCEEHSNKPVKFFCRHHNQVGCGDCMIRDHKTCKVENIHELLNGYQVSKDYKQFRKDIEKNCYEAKRIKKSINNNRGRIIEVNKKFKFDVIKFKDELIAHITNLARALLKCGDEIMETGLSSMDSLENENDCLIGETSRINDTLHASTDQPYTMLITSVKYKKKLNEIQKQLNRIKGKEIVQGCTFKCDARLKQLLQGNLQLGTIQKDNKMDKTEMQSNENSKTNERAYSISQLKYQPLIQRQLRCKNLNIDGQIIKYEMMKLSGRGDKALPSYAAKTQNAVGFYIDNRALKVGDYFEIEILGIGKDSSMAVGVVPKVYSESLLPGLGKNSRGYHSDGKVTSWQKDHGKVGNAWKKGDIIGCKILDHSFAWNIMFTHNGRKTDLFYVQTGGHFAVGMKAEGNIVKVIDC